MKPRRKRWQKAITILVVMAGIGVAWHDYGIYCRVYDCQRSLIVQALSSAGKTGAIPGLASSHAGQSGNRSILLNSSIVLKYIIQ